MTDPAIHLRRLVMGYIVSGALVAVHELGVPDQLADGPRPVAELADEVGADEDALRRFLRVLVAEDVFTEDIPDTFGLSEAGHLLSREVSGSLASLVDLMSGEAYQVWGGAVQSLRSGESTFPAMFGASYFEWLTANPEAARRFAAGQAGLVEARAQGVVDLDWSHVRTVVDVGGGNGTLLLRLLQRHPELTGIVVDLPHVVTEAAATARMHGLEGRMTAVGGDFFTDLPAGADVYVLAQILHDWDDGSAAGILAMCRRAIPDHGRLVIVEQVLPGRATQHPAALLDLHMLVLLGGRERTECDWKDLLSAGRFELLSVERGARASVLEARPV